jgi:hypothetical protein
MLRRLTRLLPGREHLESTMTVGPAAPGSSSNDPCEDCGAVPADVLVEVRYLCPSCARIERAAMQDAAESSDGI